MILHPIGPRRRVGDRHPRPSLPSPTAHDRDGRLACPPSALHAQASPWEGAVTVLQNELHRPDRERPESGEHRDRRRHVRVR